MLAWFPSTENKKLSARSHWWSQNRMVSHTTFTEENTYWKVTWTCHTGFRHIRLCYSHVFHFIFFTRFYLNLWLVWFTCDFFFFFFPKRLIYFRMWFLFDWFIYISDRILFSLDSVIFVWIHFHIRLFQMIHLLSHLILPYDAFSFACDASRRFVYFNA